MFRVRFIWVPSHDKKSENFTVPPEHTEEILRIVNRRADDEATKQINVVLKEVPIHEWRKRRKKCAEWSSDAIRWATARCRFFHNYVARAQDVDDPLDLDRDRMTGYATHRSTNMARDPVFTHLGTGPSAYDPFALDGDHEWLLENEADTYDDEFDPPFELPIDYGLTDDDVDARDASGMTEGGAIKQARDATPQRSNTPDDSADGWLNFNEDDALFGAKSDSPFFVQFSQST